MSPCTDGDELRRIHAETRELGELLESTRLPLAGLSDVCSGIEDDDSGGRPLEPEHLYRVVDLLRSGLGVRETLLPILLLPVLAPVLIAATRTFDDALGVAAVDGWAWTGLLAATALVATVVGALAYGALIED